MGQPRLGGFSKSGVPSWGPHDRGILLFWGGGGSIFGVPDVRNVPSQTLPEGSWYLPYNPTYNTPRGPYRGYPNCK